MFTSPHKGLLLLEDGTIFEGSGFGAEALATGEICFTTSMAGYYETLTDPSYSHQLVLFTHTHIGNYGVKESEEKESERIHAKGFICRNFSTIFSRSNAKSLQSLLEQYQIPVISDIDTRALVQKIRKEGAMNGLLTTQKNPDIQELKEKLQNTPSMKGLFLTPHVSTPKTYEIPVSSPQYKIAVIDYGVKQNILNELTKRSVALKVFPHHATYEEIMSYSPDGVMLTNGPGDPEAMKNEVVVIQKLLENNVPIFGICLGHQLLAIAAGCKTIKMHHGHRGCNHPVKNLTNGKCEITSQNHGFTVDNNHLSENVEVTHINLNDHSIEGIRILNKKAFSVQYHPESCPGPHDSKYLFEQFLDIMKN
ncbi:MAG: carbamoyl-phosphate synthase small chain [Bacteroidia bacterium]|nr:MAG: carbamoyl-phosphate synthase small chain [Bacteroidia bacterium]